ncbi:MAG: hypothetical protein CMO55_01515 [Verrucomicrobiales bacterium]|nr:hypothetical protein [Verrucomicrobiales bacterium]
MAGDQGQILTRRFLCGGLEDLEAHECAAEVDSRASLDGDADKCESASEEVRECSRKISYPKATAVEEELRILNRPLLY